MAESLTIDPNRSRLYENIIEQKRRQLAATSGLYARHQSPKKVGNTLASTAEDPQMQLKFTAWDEDLSEISKLTEKHSKLIDKTPEPSIFKKSFFEEQNDGLSEIHGDDEAPRMPAFTLKPAEKPEDNLHQAIDKLLAGHERAKSTRARPSGLPEPRSREPLKQFDYSRLSKSRQSSQTRAKQVQVQRKDANLSVRSKSRPCMKDKLNNKLAFLVKTYAENNDKESVSYSGLGKILCNLGILKYITVSDLDINELLIAKIKENPTLAKEETSLHSELWKYLSYYCFEGTDLVPAQLLKSVLQTMMSKTPDQQGIKDLKRSLDEYLFNIGWLSEQITEFNDYVEAEIEESNGLPLFKVFLKFEELKKKPEFKKSFTKVTFDSLKEPIVQINSGREKLKKDLDIKNKQLDRTDLMFEGYEFVFLPDRGRAAMSSSSRQEYENIIKRHSFGDLMQETQHDHFTTAYQKPMERVKANESMMRDREEQEKENYNMNLYQRGMIQLDRKEYFRQLELEKKQKVEDMESSMYSFQPRINKKGLCDCCGKMKCSYKQQLFFDGIRDNEFQNHKEIKGFDETVTRMRKGLVDRYSKDILYRRLGDANYEYIKKQEMRRKQDDYYEKNYEDENPIIIHANINIGRGQIVIIPIRANDNIAALSANVCKIHGLGTNSVVHLTRVLEEHKGKAMGNKGPTPSVISSISTSTKAVAKFKKLLHH